MKTNINLTAEQRYNDELYRKFASHTNITYIAKQLKLSKSSAIRFITDNNREMQNTLRRVTGQHMVVNFNVIRSKQDAKFFQRKYRKVKLDTTIFGETTLGGKTYKVTKGAYDKAHEWLTTGDGKEIAGKFTIKETAPNEFLLHNFEPSFGVGASAKGFNGQAIIGNGLTNVHFHPHNMTEPSSEDFIHVGKQTSFILTDKGLSVFSDLSTEENVPKHEYAVLIGERKGMADLASNEDIVTGKIREGANPKSFRTMIDEAPIYKMDWGTGTIIGLAEQEKTEAGGVMAVVNKPNNNNNSGGTTRPQPKRTFNFLPEGSDITEHAKLYDDYINSIPDHEERLKRAMDHGAMGCATGGINEQLVREDWRNNLQHMRGLRKGQAFEQKKLVFEQSGIPVDEFKEWLETKGGEQAYVDFIKTHEMGHLWSTAQYQQRGEAKPVNVHYLSKETITEEIFANDFAFKAGGFYEWRKNRANTINIETQNSAPTNEAINDVKTF